MIPYVLVVEDEDALATLLQYNLDKEGYSVSVASDGEEALIQILSASLSVTRWRGPPAGPGHGPTGTAHCQRLSAGQGPSVAPDCGGRRVAGEVRSSSKSQLYCQWPQWGIR